MLADSVEASVRSLASRDEPAIRAMVSRIIEERLNDGQFDECDLTLRDVERDPRGVRRPAPRDVPPADRLPAEQDRRARVAPRGGRRWRRGRRQRPARDRSAAWAGATGRGSTLADPRSVYLPPWRVDVTVRPGVARVLPVAVLARAAAAALVAAGAPRPASIGLILTDDRELARAQRGAHGRGRRRPTSCRSRSWRRPFPAHPGGGRADPSTGEVDFPLPPGARRHLGDIVVSVERAIDQAEDGRGGWTGDRRWAPADELRLLVVHGMLHVCGWDHAEPEEEAAMRRLEAGLLGRDAPR